jgi:hypothetical protein
VAVAIIPAAIAAAAVAIIPAAIAAVAVATTLAAIAVAAAVAITPAAIAAAVAITPAAIAAAAAVAIIRAAIAAAAAIIPAPATLVPIITQVVLGTGRLGKAGTPAIIINGPSSKVGSGLASLKRARALIRILFRRMDAIVTPASNYV